MTFAASNGLHHTNMLCTYFASQTRAPADYRLRYHDPEGCDPESCDYFMGIDTNEGNSSFLNFYLTAETEGWVAVGFSESASMVCIIVTTSCLYIPSIWLHLTLAIAWPISKTTIYSAYCEWVLTSHESDWEVSCMQSMSISHHNDMYIHVHVSMPALLTQAHVSDGIRRYNNCISNCKMKSNRLCKLRLPCDEEWPHPQSLYRIPVYTNFLWN